MESQSFYIYKGSKKVDSFYLNELPIKFNNDGTIKVMPLRMFPQRVNSCIFFHTETEALQDSVIDLIAKNENELLAMIDGKIVHSGGIHSIEDVRSWLTK